MAARGPRRPLVLRLLLLLYPRPFRERFGDSMASTFLEGRREARARDGLRGVAALWCRTLWNVVRSAVQERRSSSFDRRPGPGPESPPWRRRRPRTGPPDPLSHRTPASCPRPVLQHPGGATVTLSRLTDDLRHALRNLRRHPGFTVLVVATLALGLGASTAIFSVVHAVLLEPLPYPEPDELVQVWTRFDPESGFEFPFFPLSPPEVVDYREQSEVLESLAAYSVGGLTVVSGEGTPQRVSAARVTRNLFDTLGVAPSLGRGFTAEEDALGGPPVVVLGHGFWRERFAGDPGIVGADIRLGGRTARVVGVMPAGFDFPSPDVRLWTPLGLDLADPGGRSSHWLSAIGRLRDGAGLERARDELDTLMAAWRERYPEIHTGHYLVVRSREEQVVGNVRSAMALLAGAAGFVLLIVCANVASVLLARGEERSRELAVRAALGAGRGRILRLVLMESILLALLGGLAGVGLAHAGTGFLLDLQAAGIPRVEGVGVDGSVLGFAALTTLLAAVLFAALPAWRAGALDLREHLKEGRGSRGHAGGSLFRRGLVVAEVALCFLLVLGAGLMIRSLGELMAVEPGFRAADVAVAGVALPDARQDGPGEVALFFRELAGRVESLPGVERASVGSAVPLLATGNALDFQIEGETAPGPGEAAWNAHYSVVRPGFFETLGIGVVRGRGITAADSLETRPVVVVNETMARRFSPGRDPIGRRMRVASGSSGALEWMTVVGIVEDVRYEGLDLPPRPSYYASHEQAARVSGEPYRQVFLLARAPGVDLGDLAAAMREILADMDPELPLTGVQAMSAVVESTVARPRFTATLLGLFAAVALALGTVGIYGTLAYAVAQRRREIGIRKALGAPPARLGLMVVGQAMALVATGLVIGGIGWIWVNRFLAGLLYGVESTDPLTWATVVGSLGAVALLASLVPTLRAVAVDARETLRG